MPKSTSLNSAFVVTVGMALAVGVANSAIADNQWQQNHPRREQVNIRLAHQSKRIQNQVKEGELTKGQAVALHKDDHQIRQEERAMASQNGGHITKQQQKRLNQHENRVSGKIGS